MSYVQSCLDDLIRLETTDQFQLGLYVSNNENMQLAKCDQVRLLPLSILYGFLMEMLHVIRLYLVQVTKPNRLPFTG